MKKLNDETNLLKPFNNFFNKLFNLKKEVTIELTPHEILEDEIAEIEETLSSQNRYVEIQASIKKIIFKKLDIIRLTTENIYVKQACKLLKERSEDRLLETLYYLDTIPIAKLNKDAKKEIYECGAYISEIIQEYKRASNYYKIAINLANDVHIVHEFKKYLERYNKLTKSQEKIIEEDDKIEDEPIIYSKLSPGKMLDGAKALENIALYYIRSPKSRQLAKKYYKEALYLYKELYKVDKQKYGCNYIKILLDGVEFFMQSPIYMKEAVEILEINKHCKVDYLRENLLNRITMLRQKMFIKKSKYSTE